MPADLSALGDLVLQVGADISPLEDALNQIPQEAQKAGQAFDAFMAAGLPGTEALKSATDGLAQSIQSTGQAVQSAVGPMHAFAAADEEVYAALAKFAQPLDDVYAGMARLGQGLEQVSPGLYDVKGGAEEAGSATAAFGAELLKLAAALAVVGSLKALGEAAISAYTEIEKATISITALTGSANTASQSIEELKSFALSHDLEFGPLVQAYQRMTALGIATQQINPLLLSAANAAAAMNGDFSTAVSTIDRMVTSGNVMARTLAGIGLSTEALGKVMGVAASQVTETFKALDQSDRIEVVNQALLKFSGIAEQVDKTVGGQLQDLGTQFHFLMADIGKALEPLAKDFIDVVEGAIIPALKGLGEAFGALPDPLKEFIEAIGGLAIAVPPVLILLGQLAKAADLISKEKWVMIGDGVLYASAAFAGWQLGKWLVENIPLVTQLRDLLRDLVSIVPGGKDFQNWLNGTSASEQELRKNTDALAAQLKAMGIEIETGPNQSVYDYRKAVMDAAAANAPLIASVEGAKNAYNAHEAMLRSVTKAYQEQQQAVQNARSNLDIVKQAYAEGSASAGQLAEAQKKLDDALKTVNPSYVTAADWQKILEQTSKDLTGAETQLAAARKLLAPSIVDVTTAEQQLQHARSNVADRIKDVENAEDALDAARRAHDPKATVAAEVLIGAARANLKSATDAVSIAEKTVGESRKASAEQTKLLSGAEDAYRAGQQLLSPIQKTVAETSKELDDARAKLASDMQILLNVNREYLALPDKDKENSQQAKDLAAAKEQVVKDVKDLKTATADYNTAAADELKVQELMLSVSKDLAALQKDGLLPSTTSLREALAGLRDAQQKVVDAYNAEQTALEALKTLRANAATSAQDLKAAEDNLTLAHKNVSTAETNLHNTEKTIQEDFGLSKTAAEVLAGSVVKISDVYHDMGLKSADELQRLADVSKREYDIIAASGTASAETLRQAKIKELKDEQAALRAHGEDLDNEEKAQLRKLLEDQDYYNQQSMDRWLQLYHDIDNEVIQGLQSLTKVFTGALFGGVDNSQLKQQIADVQKQMQDATAAFQQAQADGAAKAQQLIVDNAAQLAKTLADLKKNLADRTDAYNQYITDAKQKMDDLTTAEQEKLAAQIDTLNKALQKKQEAYDEFAKTVAEKIAELTAVEAEKEQADVQKLKDALAAKTAAYQKYVQDIQDKMQAARDKEQQNIQADTDKTNAAIAAKTQSYEDSKQAILQKISQLESQGQTPSSPQVQKLQEQLNQQTKAYDDYVATQKQKLADYTKAQQDAMDTALSAYQAQLDAQTAAYDAYVQDNQKKQEDVTAKDRAELDKQIEALNTQLLKKKEALEQAKIDTEQKIEEVTKKDQEELEKQLAAVQKGIDRQTKAYNDYVLAIKQKQEEATANAKAALTQQEAALQASLDKQAAAYKKTMDGYNAQIEDFKGKFKSVWSELGDAVLKMSQNMLDSMVNAFLKPVEQAIAHSVGQWISSIIGLGTQMSTTMTDAASNVSDLTKMVGEATAGMVDLSGAASGVAHSMGQISHSLGSVSGGIGQGLSSAISGVMSVISGVVNMVTGIITAIAAVVGVIEEFRIEGTLNAIEHNTRYSMMYLGERSDGGILGVLFKVLDELRFGTMEKAMLIIRDDIELVGKPFWFSVQAHIGEIRDSIIPMSSDVAMMAPAVLESAQYLKSIDTKMSVLYTIATTPPSGGGTGTPPASGGSVVVDLRPLLIDLDPMSSAIDQIAADIKIAVGTEQDTRTVLSNSLPDIKDYTGQLTGLLGMESQIRDATGQIKSDTSSISASLTTFVQDFKAYAGSALQYLNSLAHPGLLGSLLGGGIGGLGGGGGLVESIGGVATGIADAITSLFGGSHADKVQAQIEENTRYTQLYLGGRADQGVIGILFRILDVVQYGTAEKNSFRIADGIEYLTKWAVGDLDAIKQSMWNATADLDAIKLNTTMGNVGQQVQTVTIAGDGLNRLNDTATKMLADLDYMKNPNGKESWAVADLDEIKNNTYYTVLKLDALAHGGGSVAGASAETTSLASFVSSQFSTLVNWLSPMFRSLLVPTGGQGLAVVPTLPVFGSALPAGTSHQTNSLTVQTNINGPVYGGPNALNDLSNAVGNRIVDRLRQAGLKFQ